MSSRQIEKYLRSRAILSPWQLAGASGRDFRAAVVIPALAELQSLPLTLASLATNSAESLLQTLIVVVINNRADSAADQFRENQQTLNWLQTQPFPTLNLAWVDVSSAGLQLPAKDGVGLARKLGFDLALSRLNWQRSPLLISLDADTLVDSNYLTAIYAHFRPHRCGGAALPFRHQPADNPAQEQAIRRYELYLRSQLFGLQMAGSPYAYHSIGSAFSCRAEAYVKAGGMNRRLAGEDFYFLQQLAKTCGVEMLSGTLVQPSPRFSTRVSFGTGRAVQGQVEQGRELFGFTSAAAFQVLQGWLRLVNARWEDSAASLLAAAGELSPVLAQALEGLDFATNWQKLQQNHRRRPQFLSAFHGWFDALRSRQLLTRLDVKPLVAQATLIDELLAWGGYPGLKSAEQQLAKLEILQGCKATGALF
ncbi:MAG TPA: hypothetical protein VIR78_00015 [Malonomonas sp.]